MTPPGPLLTAERLVREGRSDEEVERLTGATLVDIVAIRAGHASLRRPTAASRPAVVATSAAPEDWWRCTVVRRAGEAVADRRSGEVVCFVRSGWVARTRLLEDGRRQILELLLPGDHYAPDSERWRDDALLALSRCEVASVSRLAVRSAAAASERLQAELAGAERRRRAMLEESLVRLGRRDALSRTAHLLCELLTRLGEGRPCTSCDFPLTQVDLSDALGLSVVHTNRTLQLLRRGGLIALARTRLDVPDFAALARVGDFRPDYLG